VVLLDQRRQRGVPVPEAGILEEDEEDEPLTSFVYSEPWPK